MAQRLRFAYDKEADILDISLGKPQQAISREIEDDFLCVWIPGRTRSSVFRS